jgi:hypothetical protein
MLNLVPTEINRFCTTNRKVSLNAAQRPEQTSAWCHSLEQCRITVNRLEDKIRDLCTKIVSDEDNPEVVATAVQLREALHEHLKCVRARMSAFPPPVERRTAQILCSNRNLRKWT